MSTARHSPRMIGTHNSALLDALADSYAACLRLAELGMQIECVTVDHHDGQPRIEIADAGRRARQLHGEVTVRRPLTQRHTCEHGGCIIEWEAPT